MIRYSMVSNKRGKGISVVVTQFVKINRRGGQFLAYFKLIVTQIKRIFWIFQINERGGSMFNRDYRAKTVKYAEQIDV